MSDVEELARIAVSTGKRDYVAQPLCDTPGKDVRVYALGERIVAVLKQRNNAPVEVAHQVCIIYAVTHGYLHSVSVDQVPEFEQRLEEHMNNFHADVLEAIRSSGKLESDTEAALKTALDELVKQFAPA